MKNRKIEVATSAGDRGPRSAAFVVGQIAMLGAACLLGAVTIAQAETVGERAPGAGPDASAPIERPADPTLKAPDADQARPDRDRGDFAEEDMPGCGLWNDKPLDLIV